MPRIRPPVATVARIMDRLAADFQQIGGAGTFDGIFANVVLAVLIASVVLGIFRRRPRARS
jgi:hypothetical protein